jgi:inner membrane transporter RhtA
MVAASLAAAPFGVADATRELDLEVLAVAALATVLLPLLPYALEMLAPAWHDDLRVVDLDELRARPGRPHRVVILDQDMSALQALGVSLVIAAGVGAVRRGRRPYSESPVDGAVGRA